MSDEEMKIPRLPMALALLVAPEMREGLVEILGEEMVKGMEDVKPHVFVIMAMHKLYPGKDVLVAVQDKKPIGLAPTHGAATIEVISSMEVQETAELAFDVVLKCIEP
jgi:hypothetical protein